MKRTKQSTFARRERSEKSTGFAPVGGEDMTQPAKHTPGPLNKAIHAIPMLYAEAFAGSNNKEFVVELYKDAQLLETAAPAMYEALVEMVELRKQLAIDHPHLFVGKAVLLRAEAALAQAEGKQ